MPMRSDIVLFGDACGVCVCGGIGGLRLMRYAMIHQCWLVLLETSHG